MIVTSVQLENFKKHEDLTVDFTAGTNLIIGNNYAGKSTIVQAIMLGLFGNSAVPGQTTDLVRSGSLGFAVSLTLSNGDQVKRTAKNSTVTDKHGAVTVRTHTAVNDYMAKLLGVDKKTFLKVFCSEQGSPQALLSMEGAELQRFIEVCLGVDLMDKVVKESSMQARLLQVEIDSKSEFLMSPQNHEDSLIKLHDFEKTCRDLTEGIDKGRALERKIKEDIAKLNRDVHKQEGVNRELEMYEGLEKVLSDQLASLPEPRKADDPTVYDDELSVLEAELKENSKAQEDVLRINEALSKLVSEEQGYLKTIREFQEKHAEPMTSEAESKESDRLGRLLSGLSEELTSVRSQITSGVCSECKRPYDDASHIDLLRESLTTLLAKRGEYEEEVVTADTLTKKAKRLETAYLAALRQCTDARALLAKCYKQMEELKESLLRLPRLKPLKEAEVLGDRYTQLMTMRKEVEAQVVEVLAEAKTRLRLDAEYAKLTKPSGTFLDLTSQYSVLQVKADTLADASALALKNELDKAYAESEIKALEVAFESHSKVKDSVTQLGITQSNYTTINTVVNASRGKIIDSGFAQILAIASEFVATCTGGDISEVYLGDGGIRYKEGEHNRGTVCASGAQKTLIGLGLKLGMSQIVASPFGCLLLDEVSADMDADISLACLTVLGDYCQQAIAVSHRPMDVADNVIEV